MMSDWQKWYDVAAKLHQENAKLKDQVTELTEWRDVMFGTPDEAIRHAQVVDALNAERNQLKVRLRTVSQLGIAEIGADGPEDAESVVGRLVLQVQQLKARLAESEQAAYDVNGPPVPHNAGTL